MKLPWCLGLIWALMAAQLPAAGGKLERVQLFGTEYVRLEDWAAAYRFQLQWTGGQQTVKASSRWSTLEFTVNSRKMSVNGVNVWLSAPVALCRGSAHVGTMDLATALHPVLFPPKGAGNLRTVCLDPGHGGKDPGNHNGKQQEKSYTLQLARELSSRLRKAGFKVQLTRSSDRFVDLPARPDVARRCGADLFISLHFNATAGSGAEGVNGVEVYCMTPAHASSTNGGGEGGENGEFPGNRCDAKNMLLAYQVQKRLTRNLGAEDRGVRRARFAVLRNADMPAVLIEGGYLSNPGEAQKIHDRAYHRRMAEAIVEGIVAYKKVLERTNG